MHTFVTSIAAERHSVKAGGFFWTIDLDENKRSAQASKTCFHTLSIYAMIEPNHATEKTEFPTVKLLRL
jgi:hypothetical protein